MTAAGRRWKVVPAALLDDWATDAGQGYKVHALFDSTTAVH